ncbi:MFS transporter [Cohnella kolymensis]|uniref:MFS transporter n=1 Tax=Cohnella kolymensis TaxID=1590652 RepID=UPI0009E60236
MPVYYQSAIGGTDADWSFTQTAAALVIALLSPLLGAIADHMGNKVGFLRLFTVLGSIASVCLAFTGAGDVWLASILVVAGMIGFGSANTFYDALLNDITSPAERDKVSARGYAMGYLGGGVLLTINLTMIMKYEWFGLPDGAAATRISFVMVGVWWLLFSIPLLKHVKEAPVPVRGKVMGHVWVGFRRLGETFTQLKDYPELLKFMVSFWFFSNGIGTIIVMAASYGKTIGIEDTHLIAALLITQFVGFPATVVFGKFAHRFGGKKMLYGSLLTYLVIVIMGYFMQNATHFFILASLVGLVQGGSQAIARAMFSRLIPNGRTAEYNGFLSASTRFFSFGGPLVFGLVKVISDSSRAAILAVAVFFIVGIVLLYFVNLAKGEREAGEGPAGPRIIVPPEQQIPHI